MKILKKFLTLEEIVELITFFKGIPSWEVTRKGVKAYDFAPCSSGPIGMISKALKELDEDNCKFYDSFFLNYTNGCKIPWHKDQRSKQRMNVCLIRPESGGILYIENEKVELDVGDAVIFHPSIENHCVDEVKGQRLIWSVGRTSDKGR